MRAATQGPLIVAGVALCLYAAALSNGYALDDHRAVLGHPAVTGEVGLLEVFSREFWGRPLAQGWSSSYRPLTTLTLALEHRVVAAPWLHHLGNALAYAALCGVLVRFARRWCSPAVAVGAGLCFAVLPVHVESVASIVGRADVLAALASLGALAQCLPIAGSPSRPSTRAVLAALLYAVALLCKESVALLPGLAAWLVWMQVRPRTRAQWSAFVPVAALAMVGVAYIVARQQLLPVGLPDAFVPADNLLVAQHGAPRVWGNFAVLGHYAELVFIPRRLCADHTYADIIPPTSLLGVGAAWAWVGVAVVLIFAWDVGRALAGRSAGLGGAVALSYLLLGQWVVDLSVILAERLALWPTVWLVLWLAAATERPWQALDRARRRRIAVLLFVLLGLASARTIDRSLDWHDSVTVQRSSLAQCPAAVHGRFILANALRERGEAEEAVWHYGVAGAGRHAFPEPFDVPAFDAEATMPLAERLPRLPELVGAPDARAFWAALHMYLVAEHANAEADVVRRLATGDARR